MNIEHRQQSMSGKSTADDPQKKKVDASGLFDKAHKLQSENMEKITTYCARMKSSNAQAALVLSKRKCVGGPVQITGKTRKSSAVVKRDCALSTPLSLYPVSKKVVPGGFGDNDGEDDQEDDVQKSKCVRIDAAGEADRKGKETKKFKDREAIHQKVDVNHASINSSGVPPISDVCVPQVSHATFGGPPISVFDLTSSCTSTSPIPLFAASGTTRRMSHRRNSASSLRIASRKNNAGSVSSTSTKTSSTFMVPTASSLAKTRRLPVPSYFPFQVKYKGKEKLQKETDAVEFSDGRPKSGQNLQSTVARPLVGAFGAKDVLGSSSCHARHGEASNPTEAEGNARTAAVHIKGGQS